jgi:Domain of Unknown Function (DUF1080)
MRSRRARRRAARPSRPTTAPTRGSASSPASATSTASFTTNVKVKEAGDYAFGRRYSNGPNPFSGTKSVSVYANRRKINYKLHVEFKVPLLLSEVTGQDRGNSGVYQQERDELQILDSYGDTTLDDNEAGAMYTIKAPDADAATAPETWQTYDVTYRAARYDAAGAETENARITVIWNGVTVQDDVELPRGTGGDIAEGPSTGAIRLQDHGNKVRYRNIWIEPTI